MKQLLASGIVIIRGNPAPPPRTAVGSTHPGFPLVFTPSVLIGYGVVTDWFRVTTVHVQYEYGRWDESFISTRVSEDLNKTSSPPWNQPTGGVLYNASVRRMLLTAYPI